MTARRVAPPRSIIVRALSDVLGVPAEDLYPRPSDDDLQAIYDRSVSQWDGGRLESLRVVAAEWLADDAPPGLLRTWGVHERIVDDRQKIGTSYAADVRERLVRQGRPLKEREDDE